MGYGDDVVVVNRSILPLGYCYDGRHGVIKPGYKVDPKDPKKVIPAGRNGRPAIQHMLFQVAEMARRQNIIYGTEDPHDLREVQYLIGVVEEGDDGVLFPAPNWPQNAITHCEQSDAKERLNRALLDPEAQTAQNRRAGGWPRSRAATDALTRDDFRAGNESPVGLDVRG